MVLIASKNSLNTKFSAFRLISAHKILMVTAIICWVMVVIFVRKISYHQGEKLKNIALSTRKENNEIGSNVKIKYAYSEMDTSSKEIKDVTMQPIATVAYVISVTACSEARMIDGAAVLKHSIHLSSIHNPSSTSKYSYHMVAFVHPDAVECSRSLEILGYEVKVRDVPFDRNKIRGSKWLRENIHKGGCCGDKEFLKLYAYTLIEYPIIVHLDLDVLILQPMDELFDAMILMNDSNKESSYKYKKKISIQFPDKDVIPDKIDAYFTRDYNLADHHVKHVGVQGGFLIFRPGMDYFNEYLNAILEGEFPNDYAGWGGLGYGGYYGARQVQGIVSYFNDHLHAGTAVELNRCVYNTMIDNPRYPSTTEKEGLCKDTNTYECENCRKAKFSDIKSAHFTLCQKPWQCDHATNPKILLCNDIRRFWFKVRKDLEEVWTKSGLIPKMGYDSTSKYFPDIFHGYCTTGGHRYIPIQLPSKPVPDLRLS